MLTFLFFYGIMFLFASGLLHIPFPLALKLLSFQILDFSHLSDCPPQPLCRSHPVEGLFFEHPSRNRSVYRPVCVQDYFVLNPTMTCLLPQNENQSPFNGFEARVYMIYPLFIPYHHPLSIFPSLTPFQSYRPACWSPHIEPSRTDSCSRTFVLALPSDGVFFHQL